MANKNNVTVIPASISMMAGAPLNTTAKRRVAAYARVSTDSSEQENSFEAQCDYYTKYINEHPDWEFVTVYSDEGITGCNTKKREGFKQMVTDGLAGMFDLLITKSVSRFARNTVDSLQTIRDLKDAGVEVFFEKEAIWTFDGKGELLITIMASLAQEEARGISTNVTWGKRRSFEEGKAFSAGFIKANLAILSAPRFGKHSVCGEFRRGTQRVFVVVAVSGKSNFRKRTADGVVV